ncbi:MAG: PEP-CTERM motif [Rhodobacteraceae bacterium HLUCCO07]|nr:MAG: PEP-CTERM motif [Rhodobacteraceae bacterium HLUCCO07]
MTRVFAVFTLTMAVGFALVPFLTSGFNGFTPDQFPVPQTDPPVQPAGYAFSIWGLIYIWLIAGAGYGLVKRPDAPGWHAARPALLVSLLIGMFWIPLAQISVPWATVMIWLMLVTALAALLRAHRQDRLWLREPIGLYAGWLTAASAVSVGLMLAGYGVTGPTVAALVALVLALVIATAITRARPDTLAYPLGVIWALIGVVVQNLEPLDPATLGLAVIGIAALGAQAWRNARAPR